MSKGFHFIGISTRTSNKNNRSAIDITELWFNFFHRKIFDNINNKLIDNIVAIYTDYESDYTGEYTALLGVMTTDINHIPEGMIGRFFPVENFKTFTAKGEMPKAVMKVWDDIWKNDAKLRRKYTYDMEIYGENSMKGDRSEVDIMIAVEE